MNKGNAPFYENIPPAIFDQFAKDSGLESCVDLDQIFSKIKKNSTIIEIGSGRGRIVQGLLDRGYLGRIICLERDPKFYSFLKKNFEKARNIEPINGDILDIDLPAGDYTLMTWSVLWDFSYEEQKVVLEKISKSTKETIFIDLPRSELETNATSKKGKDLALETPFGTVRGYAISQGELEDLSERLGRGLTQKQYFTDNKRKRVVYMLSK